MASLAQAQSEFHPSGIYLNTATVGIPPTRTVTAVQDAIARWAGGDDNGPDFDPAIDRSRAAYAAMVGVPVDAVAIGSQTSVMTGIVAAGLPDDASVLLAAGDFTSVMFPFLEQQRRGVEVRDVPLDAIAAEIGPETSIVAVSAVQSADGAIADLDAIESAAREHGAEVLIDLTQSAGWFDVDASRFDYTVCGAYKWLMAPRGGGFLTVRDHHVGRLPAHGASWYGGEDVWSAIYGSPLRLAETARRYDASPAWFSWIGLDTSLALINELGVDIVGEHSVGLANRFRSAIGLEASTSAIVSVAVREGVEQVLAHAGITAAIRAGRLRLSFYIYNTEQDVDRAVEVLTPYL